MTTDDTTAEKIGREWAERNGKRPIGDPMGVYWDLHGLPRSIRAELIGTGKVAIYHDDDHEAYAALGRALREIREAIGPDTEAERRVAERCASLVEQIGRNASDILKQKVQHEGLRDLMDQMAAGFGVAADAIRKEYGIG